MYKLTLTRFAAAPVNKIFNTISTFAAESPRFHSHFNAGVLLLSPSDKVFKELMAQGEQGHSKLFGNLIDCTEQGLLNSYFNGDAGREVTKLTVGRADVKVDWTKEDAPFAVHWITHVCPKPWTVTDDATTLDADCDPVVYGYWQRIWNRLTASSTKDQTSALTFGSREAVRRQLRRMTGVTAGPSMTDRSPRYDSVGSLLTDLRDSVGRQLRRRRKMYEYDAPRSETSSPSSSPFSSAGGYGDPHMIDGRGGRFDFRGKNDTIYNLLSTDRVSFNALFKTADYTDAGPKHRLVHGSFINSVFFFARTDRGTVQAEYDATRAVFIYVGNNTATPTKHRAPIEIDFDGLTVSLDNRVAKFTTATWVLSASSKYKEGILGRGSSCSTGKCFLEVTVKPLADADNAKVAPHGLIGQAFDGAGTPIVASLTARVALDLILAVCRPST